MYADRMTPRAPTLSDSVLDVPPFQISAPSDPPSAIPMPVPDNSPDGERLRALADSVRQRGIRIPLLVRSLPPSAERIRPCPYALLAGERRLTAARLAGVKTVPCVPVDPPGLLQASADEDPGVRPVRAAEEAIAENLRAGDLNLFESASAVSALISLAGLTQEQCADRLGVSQSYVANKLRLLRLTEDERRLMLENRLTERHGRALLRFPTPEERAPVLAAMIRREMNVAAAEEYVESLLCADARAAARRSLAENPPPSLSEAGSAGRQSDLRRLILRDTRRFTDSIDQAVDVIRRAGIPVEARRRDTPAGTLISILLPKTS